VPSAPRYAAAGARAVDVEGARGAGVQPDRALVASAATTTAWSMLTSWSTASRGAPRD
jgi:hypothetical protein